MNMKCAICGSDKFHLDIENQILSCSACSFYCDFKALVRGSAAPHAQAQPQRPAYNPADFEIVGGVLKKYKGAAVDVVVPDGVIEIGENAFAGQKYLQSVRFSNGVKRIGESAFRDCANLSTLQMPDTLTEIGGSAFCGCLNLTRIDLPKNVVKIGGGAFWNCTNLKEIGLPDSLKSIGNLAFESCKSLTKMILPGSLEEIGEAALAYCSNLVSINIPRSVERITKTSERHSPPSNPTWYSYYFRTFDGCDKLSQVTYPSDRFTFELFRGSLYYRQHPEGRKILIRAKTCPDCKGKLGMFKKCQKCGKMW